MIRDRIIQSVIHMDEVNKADKIGMVARVMAEAGKTESYLF
jgi:hypothetical protein